MYILEKLPVYLILFISTYILGTLPVYLILPLIPSTRETGETQNPLVTLYFLYFFSN